jgi:imidazolonepropionase-like amidohydrolase
MTGEESAPTPVATSWQEPIRRTVVRAGHTFAATTANTAMADQAIVIEGTVITQITPWADFQARVLPSDFVVDASDCFVLPGLINSHVHLTFMYSTGFGHHALQNSPVAATMHAMRVETLLLAQGITTARDMGGTHGVPLAIRESVERGRAAGPRILSCNQPICAHGGHAAHICRPASGADEWRQAAREQLAAGADFVKFMASHDPWSMPGVEQTRPEATTAEISAAVETAHSWGRPAGAHVMGSEAIRRVLDAGIDLIEHGHYLTQDQARVMAERGVVLTPTLSSYDVQTMHPRFGRGDSWKRAHKTLIDGHRAAVDAAINAGVRMLVGTDSVGCYAEEVALLRNAGVSAVDSLLACTRYPAQAFGLLEDLGTIEVGKRADLVLLSEDPLADPYALEAVRAVFKDGAMYEPDTLMGAIPEPERQAFLSLARSPKPDVSKASLV